MNSYQRSIHLLVIVIVATCTVGMARVFPFAPDLPEHYRILLLTQLKHGGNIDSFRCSWDYVSIEERQIGELSESGLDSRTRGDSNIIKTELAGRQTAICVDQTLFIQDHRTTAVAYLNDNTTKSISYLYRPLSRYWRQSNGLEVRGDYYETGLWDFAETTSTATALSGMPNEQRTDLEYSNLVQSTLPLWLKARFGLHRLREFSPEEFAASRHMSDFSTSETVESLIGISFKTRLSDAVAIVHDQTYDVKTSLPVSIKYEIHDQRHNVKQPGGLHVWKLDESAKLGVFNELAEYSLTETTRTLTMSIRLSEPCIINSPDIQLPPIGFDGRLD